MSDWRPRLIASDMDGTLLRSDETVAPATLEQIRAWGEDGVPFVLATGRPPRWMLSIREVVPEGVAVCCNGAVQLDLEPQRVAVEVEHEGSHRVLPAELESAVLPAAKRAPQQLLGARLLATQRAGAPPDVGFLDGHGQLSGCVGSAMLLRLLS